MLLDTGGGILRATKSFKKPFVAINPDTLWNEAYSNELKNLEDLYFTKKSPCLLLVNKNLSFERDKINLGLSPIRSSYHKLDCFFDRMVWNRDSAALFFFNNGDSNLYPAVMESFDFYHESRFEDIASLDTCTII